MFPPSPSILKSLPAGASRAPKPPAVNAMSGGQALFVQHCAVCHLAPRPDYPKLGGNTVVLARNPDTVLRVILQGAQSVVAQNQPAGFSMPAFPGLNDAELAEIATYIRNSWGNRASAVSANDAAKLRRAIAGRD